MNSPLANPAFRSLFASQICSLLGVGLLTVALSLAAYRIGGAAFGGQLLGMLLALKMVAYVVLAPLAETLLSGLRRKPAMVSLGLGRMLLLLPMTFVTQTWQVAALVFVFFSLTAGFTPLFQSVVPDILPEEDVYTKALAWSRVAYTLEAVLSPVIAAVLLNGLAAHELFFASATFFAGSVLALLLTHFPTHREVSRKGPFLKSAFRGVWIYRQTPRLRGLVLLNLSLSIVMAWVLVNTVVYAGARLGNAERFFPMLMASYGIGAALGAFAVPKLLHRISERNVILIGVSGFSVAGAAFATLPIVPAPLLTVIWAIFGFVSSLVITPGGLVTTRSAARRDRPAVFAAQFSLSHAAWLVAYPLAGWLGGVVSLEMALLVLSGMSAVVASVAILVWPNNDPLERAHSHHDLPDKHPHLKQVPVSGASRQHVHAYHIDDLHPNWNRRST
ncbi:MFS transporter [Ruegeria hyattellae]|uniref:MFS transporter n=1 Tax=Ruegeria hyattellae TaxID=3233337 RepID=UPI00355B0FD4